ncbi:MAG TPA: hypothetical protein VMZ27_16135 [Candidatus Saccharimonadales bacterium]|nr:hypothetical protein [Candidatus Saccharimonadales bacterium]
MITTLFKTAYTFTGLSLALLAAGCASTGDKPQTTAAGAEQPSRYKLADGRTVEIGKASPADGGMSYKNPHLEKCWVASGFDFNGYDTLYIAPTASTAKYNQKDEEVPLQLARENLVTELKRALATKGMFPNIVTNEKEIKPGAKVLKLENTILEYAKGGGAARYFAGIYGAGQPVLRVQGKATEGDKSLFAYEARRSGVSAGARMTGAFMKDVDIQYQDIQSLVLDLTDFMAIVAKKAPLRN